MLISADELARPLEDMARLVRNGDSFEASDPPAEEPDDAPAAPGPR